MNQIITTQIHWHNWSYMFQTENTGEQRFSSASATHIKCLEKTMSIVKTTYRYRFQCHTMIGAHSVDFEAFRFYKESLLLKFMYFKISNKSKVIIHFIS